jgi:hypothetical protein
MHQPETEFIGELQEFTGTFISPDDPSLEPRERKGRPADRKTDPRFDFPADGEKGHRNNSLEHLAEVAKRSGEKHRQAAKDFLNCAYDDIAADHGRLPARTTLSSRKSGDLEKTIIEELTAECKRHGLQREIPESTIREFVLWLMDVFG